MGLETETEIADIMRKGEKTTLFRARIHAKLRDPVWWAMTACFLVCMLWFGGRELTRAYLLYTPETLAYKVQYEQYPLPWLYKTFGDLFPASAFAGVDAFLEQFIPAYRLEFSNLVLQSIAKSSNVMCLMQLFPPLYLARRMANGECLQLISAGHAQTKVFWALLLDTVFHTALLYCVTGTLTWMEHAWGYISWDPAVFLRCMVLRLPMLIAWLMPTIFACFATQSMLLSTLASFGLLMLQGCLGKWVDNVNLFPAWTYTQNSEYALFWAAEQSQRDVWAYLWPCLAAIVFWSLASLAVYRIRALRTDVG